MRVFNGLLTSNWALGFPKYTTGFQSHTLWFSLFLVVARRSSDSHYGLAAYVWSHDIGRALRAAHAIEAGWVQVNQGLGQSPGHSYGGYKESGIGREFSLEGMLESYTQRKNVTVNLTH